MPPVFTLHNRTNEIAQAAPECKGIMSLIVKEMSLGGVRMVQACTLEKIPKRKGNWTKNIEMQ